MAIQLAKLEGAIITSVCSSKNFELVKSLASDCMIDYRAQDAESYLETYKYVIDALGKSKSPTLKEESKRALSQRGKYISIHHGTPLTCKNAFLNLKSLA